MGLEDCSSSKLKPSGSPPGWSDVRKAEFGLLVWKLSLGITWSVLAVLWGKTRWSHHQQLWGFTVWLCDKGRPGDGASIQPLRRNFLLFLLSRWVTSWNARPQAYANSMGYYEKPSSFRSNRDDWIEGKTPRTHWGRYSREGDKSRISGGVLGAVHTAWTDTSWFKAFACSLPLHLPAATETLRHALEPLHALYKQLCGEWRALAFLWDTP